MAKKNRVTVRLPQQLEKELMHRVIVDDYGMKGKSRWVGEAVQLFMALEDFEDYVEYAVDLVDTKTNKLQSFYLEEELVIGLKDAVIRARIKYPDLEGVRSLIIRSSIIQRLFRGVNEYGGLRVQNH